MIFIDKTAASTKTARHHGHWKTTTFTAGLRIGGLAAFFVLDGPMDGDGFRAYVDHVLVANLAPGDVVVMDNLPAYKVRGMLQAIETAGAMLLCLPDYSPDFNPIENGIDRPDQIACIQVSRKLLKGSSRANTSSVSERR